MMYPEINPVAFELGPLAVHWYGLMYLFGFAGAWALARYRVRRDDALLTAQQVDDLIFYAALGVIVGGRLGYTLFYGFDQWLADPLALFRLWEGGMSFHGGALGVIAALAWFAQRHRLSLYAVGDFIVPMVPIGLLTGRIGNFINGELWGAPGSVPWAMQVSCAGRYDLCQNKLGLPADAAFTPPLHPTQLYEAALEGLLLFVLLWWFSSKPRSAPMVSALFLIGYGVFRFAVEWLRMPDAHLGYLAFGWLTMGQLLSLPMVLAGIGLLLIARKRANRV